MCKNDNDKELTSAADKLPGKQNKIGHLLGKCLNWFKS